MDTEYILRWILHHLGTLTAGRNYKEWEKGTHGLQHAVISNKKLAEELEKKCIANGGVLTYSEFLQTEQFGRHGYHETHQDHGMTLSHKHWGKSLALLCKKNEYKNIIEFGAGDGKMGIEIIKEAKKLHYNVIWNGIEINDFAREEIQKRFQKNKLTKNLGILSKSLDEFNDILGSKTKCTTFR